jgi:hypothetical protein
MLFDFDSADIDRNVMAHIDRSSRCQLVIRVDAPEYFRIDRKVLLMEDALRHHIDFGPIVERSID